RSDQNLVTDAWHYGVRAVSWDLGLSPQVGIWQAAVEINGVEVPNSRHAFVVGPTVSFRLATSQTAEATGHARLEVVLSRPSTQTVTVNYAVTGGTANGYTSSGMEPSAAAAIALGLDYRLPAGTLTFMPGETSKFIDLSIYDDSRFELNETVQV